MPFSILFFMHFPVFGFHIFLPPVRYDAIIEHSRGLHDHAGSSGLCHARYAPTGLASFLSFPIADLSCSGDPSNHRIGGVEVALARRFAVFQDGRR
jgi:hypothetical protein